MIAPVTKFPVTDMPAVRFRDVAGYVWGQWKAERRASACALAKVSGLLATFDWHELDHAEQMALAAEIAATVKAHAELDREKAIARERRNQRAAQGVTP